MAKKADMPAALTLSAAAGAEPVVFPGFPGRFVPGSPVDLGFLSAVSGVPASDLVDLAAELGLPLRLTGSADEEDSD